VGGAGLNLKDPPQLLDPRSAQKNVNYLVEGDGILTKRKGLEQLFTVAGNVAITTNGWECADCENLPW
jgi:hypothetical protein